MGIYIKGIDLPSCCDKCPFKTYVGADHLKCKITGYRFYVWEVGWGDKPYVRHESCPLIEIPDKHGRLIDADALAKDYDGFPVRIDPWVWNELSHAPTIIPAEPCNDLAKPNIDADCPPSIPLKQVWTELFGEECE